MPSRWAFPQAREGQDEVVVGTDEAVLAGLDAEQREVALATRGPVCVLAGAGTGKTRAITHRIAYAVSVGVVSPAHVLALTFTVRAAGELRGRLRQLGAAGQGSAPGWSARPRSTRPRCGSSTTSGRASSAGVRRR